ncbi:MAG: DUF5615 family PIN-like protein [Bacteroidetes bacterium]|nr:DUF5615 family PIN-like protein [Bacteroidota bacterium]
MKVLIDMNLSPEWVSIFKNEGWEAVHWSAIGVQSAPDTILMRWANENGHIVFTHDLDFGAILAATRADSPSVFQVRTQDVMPEVIGQLVVATLRKFSQELNDGAIVTVNETKDKVRILPI